ncbi:unnamed protein product [Strongylus vulgaris]|uniref:Uncharacterized protein n=1 Tax=Strongylus vulgaris TaxID=40348 RepID=A0A3P7IM60_STRVU|nr:unnamed protein product [Strongylus vulgaris]
MRGVIEMVREREGREREQTSRLDALAVGRLLSYIEELEHREFVLNREIDELETSNDTLRRSKDTADGTVAELKHVIARNAITIRHIGVANGARERVP